MFSSEAPARAAFLTDAAGTVVNWNDGCEALFGLPAAQIIDRPMSVLLSGSAPQELDARWSLLPHQCAVLVLPIRCAGGITLIASVTLAPQQDQAGRLQGWIAAFTTELADDRPESTRVRRAPLVTVVDSLPGTFYVINQERHFVLWNHNLEVVTEMLPPELGAVKVPEMFSRLQRPTIEEKIRRVFEEGAEVTIEADYVAKSGRLTPFLLCGSRVYCDGVPYLFGMGIDISVRRDKEQQLRLRNRALHASSNGIVITRCEGNDNPIEYVNPAFERITGYTLEEVAGRDSRFMAAPGLDQHERAALHDAVQQRRALNVVFRNLRKNGELFWNDLSITPVHGGEDGAITHFIGVIVDVTGAKQRTAHLEHEVTHDALTGLANRTLMWDRLEHSIQIAQRHKSLVAVVLVDLNNFKTINDTYGHEAGDIVLQVVAKRLLASVRDSDTVSRLSGDEFVLVLDNQPSLRYTLRRLECLREQFALQVTVDTKNIPVGASVGVSIYPHDGITAFDLVRAADVAMYNAKATGKSDIYFYSADMKATTQAKRRLEASMHEALEHKQFSLVFQPRVSGSSGKITGLEALLRWQHPEQGLKLPLMFLREAEENGLIVPIGHCVLELACIFIRELEQLGYAGLPVAVNVSYREYQQQDFIPGVCELTTSYGIAPGSLEIELREENIVRDPALACDVARQLRLHGVAVAVDEFGQGMFDLSLLQELGARYIKIAKTAVHAISVGETSGAMAKTLAGIGHNLDLRVVGQAVETREQMDYLTALGCDEIQGSYVSAPLAAHAIFQLLHARRADTANADA